LTPAILTHSGPTGVVKDANGDPVLRYTLPDGTVQETPVADKDMIVTDTLTGYMSVFPPAAFSQLYEHSTAPG
jgi:hypothetical protein